MNTLIQTGPISQLVLQPTPFCNLSCTYCYLTKESRANTSRMSPSTAEDAVRYVYDSGLANKKLMIRWHAGEPLAAGINFYKEAIERIKSVVPKGHEIIHTIQTNATFINDAWCDFFKSNNFKIGVSLDGPEFLHNLYRITKNGKGSFSLAMKGIDTLKRNNIPFEAIAVLTNESLKYPDEIYEFFENIGALSLGLNIEETEGANQQSSSKNITFMAEYEVFLRRIFQLQKKGKLRIREIEEKYNFLLKTKKDIECAMTIPFYILSVDWQGNFFTFCPELLGVTHDVYSKLIFGNIKTLKINDAMRLPLFNKVYEDILEGNRKCKNECPYFFLCGGAAPGNKLFENGSFISTETAYCKSRIQIPTNIVLEDIEMERNFK